MASDAVGFGEEVYLNPYDSELSTDDEPQNEQDGCGSVTAMFDKVKLGKLDNPDQEKLRKLNSPDQVMEYMLLGDGRMGGSAVTMAKWKITHVLNVHHSCRYPPASAPYKFLHVPVDDYGHTELSRSSSDTLRKCFKFIEKGRSEGGRVFVHCRKGVNRSPTIVLAWLVQVEGWTLKKAYEHVKQVRPMMSPHERYFEQLQQLDKEKHGAISVTRSDVGPSLQMVLRQIRQEYVAVETAKQAAIDAGDRLSEDLDPLGTPRESECDESDLAQAKEAATHPSRPK